ncbi:uncharacterized protein C7orf57 homolog [Actinia tenebrosa]|uniref:Uncharacterized protein C7orf57 homolog n=1 Tax=Actinia tenebrosa TaxID=6105 RepID=A0A6P8HIC9_ACTTE|nr:uncharacterized protein C7orf57 homolog [Actinia tenebrosa]
MPNPRISTQDWYYDAPNKKSTAKAKEPPPASQIPGLSNFIEEPNEMEERQFRRKWLRDTDSNYIKLAKGGGRKHLLDYREPPSEKPEEVGYPRVDWFDHYNPEPENVEEFSSAPPPVEMPRSKRMMPRTQPHRVLPEWYVHDRRDEEEKEPLNDLHVDQSGKKKNIISFDNMSAWEREAKDEANARNGRHVKLPPLHSKGKQEKSKASKVVQQFPKRYATRVPKMDSEPVDFRHLMSMGYQRDWFDDQNQKHVEEKRKLQVERQKNDQKASKQMREAIEMRKPKYNVTEDEDRHMFKLSRFQKVQPRVESFRT